MHTYYEFDGQLPGLARCAHEVESVIRQLQTELSDEEPVFEGLAPLSMLIPTIRQFFTIMIAIDNNTLTDWSARTGFNDLSELGGYGLRLTGELELWCEYLKQDLLVYQIQPVIIGLALWLAHSNTEIIELEPVVNSIASLANKTTDTRVLSQLHNAVVDISNATAASIKNDEEDNDPQRPWRLLNINHGIIATRTHDTSIMESVYENLIKRLPLDAAEFFAEGMQQMDIIGYPKHVRKVVKHYFDKTNKPVIH